MKYLSQVHTFGYIKWTEDTKIHNETIVFSREKVSIFILCFALCIEHCHLDKMYLNV